MTIDEKYTWLPLFNFVKMNRIVVRCNYSEYNPIILMPPDILWTCEKEFDVICQKVSRLIQLYDGDVEWEMYSDFEYVWCIRPHGVREYLNNILSTPTEKLDFQAIDEMRNSYPVLSKAHVRVAALRQFENENKGVSRIFWEDVENISLFIIKSITNITEIR